MLGLAIEIRSICCCETFFENGIMGVTRYFEFTDRWRLIRLADKTRVHFRASITVTPRLCLGLSKGTFDALFHALKRATGEQT